MKIHLSVNSFPLWINTPESESQMLVSSIRSDFATNELPFFREIDWSAVRLAAVSSPDQAPKSVQWRARRADSAGHRYGQGAILRSRKMVEMWHRPAPLLAPVFLLKMGTVSPKWIVGSKSAVPKIQTFKIPSLRFKVPSIKVPDLHGYRLDWSTTKCSEPCKATANHNKAASTDTNKTGSAARRQLYKVPRFKVPAGFQQGSLQKFPEGCSKVPPGFLRWCGFLTPLPKEIESHRGKFPLPNSNSPAVTVLFDLHRHAEYVGIDGMQRS